MNVIIDTQIFLFWLSMPEKLKKKHISIIEDPQNQIEVSICSLFEITIKKSIGKLEFEHDIKSLLTKHNFTLLQIGYNHLDEYLKLPTLHKDPFDRMIIAQVKSENKPIITYDEMFYKYDIIII